jgi:hypothetical protein
MSHDLYEYGQTSPLYFKLTLNGVGVNATLVSGDVKVAKDGNPSANVTNLPVAIDPTNMPGVYSWTPSASETQCGVFVVNIKDASGGAFDENCLVVATGGNISARFAG